MLRLPNFFGILGSGTLLLLHLPSLQLLLFIQQTSKGSSHKFSQPHHQQVNQGKSSETMIRQTKEIFLRLQILKNILNRSFRLPTKTMQPLMLNFLIKKKASMDQTGNHRKNRLLPQKIRMKVKKVLILHNLQLATKLQIVCCHI